MQSDPKPARNPGASFWGWPILRVLPRNRNGKIFVSSRN